MALLPPIKLSDGNKLAALQRLDQFRKWHSLDDQRYCLNCCNVITGWEIQVVGGTRGTGPLRVICPSKRCNSIPMDWVLPTNEVLAKMSMLQTDSRSVASPKNRCAVSENSIAARLLKFAIHLKRSTAFISK
jgi:hypothetical protein